MDAWLTEAREAIAAAAGVPAAELELDDEQTGILLDLARIAAHRSGERTNAPLLCYLVGLAVREGSVDLDIIADAVKTVRTD